MELCEINSPADLANYRARLPTLTGLNSISNVQITVFPSGEKNLTFFGSRDLFSNANLSARNMEMIPLSSWVTLTYMCSIEQSGQLRNCAYNLVSCTKGLCHHLLASAFQHAEQLKSSAFLRSNVLVQAFSVAGEETWLPLLIPQALQKNF